MKHRILRSSLIISLLGGALVGCGPTQEVINNTVNVQESQGTDISGDLTSVADTQDNTAENLESEALEGLKEMDYSSYFEGINGCILFYNAAQKQGEVYQLDLAKKQASPCSTFKIVSTLMGLHEGVLQDVNSKMGYDGKTQYPFEAWNTDLTLKDAFASSCVWYFRKVIDGVGEEKVASTLEALQYGNCDISKWQGDGINGNPDVDGFWLESSLQISPMEQVQVLNRIFEEKVIFTDEERQILKDVMLLEENENYKVYGKTGTGYGDNAWFVGFVEKSGENAYFAIRLNEEALKGEKSKTVTGNTAKEIALKIIADKY